MKPGLLVAGLLVAFMGAAAAERAEPREYVLDQDRSRIWVVTHRSGLLSFLGHKHAIVPTMWSARFCLADPVPAGATASLVIETKSLVIDSDAARALAGLGGGPGEEDMQEMQRKLLDADRLAADQYPEIRLDLVAVAPARNGAVNASVRLGLRGVTREYQLPVQLATLADQALQLTGRLRVRQRHFGIEPESVAGVVKVADEVDLHFRLVVTSTTTPCQPPG